MRKTILQKILLKIPGVTAKQVDTAVDSTIHANEITLEDAIARLEKELEYWRWVIFPLIIAIFIKVFFGDCTTV